MDEIVDAINQREVLRVSYDGGDRHIEPHAIGSNSNTGKTLIRAFQTDGASVSGEAEGWKLMSLGKISSIEKTGETFSPRPDYVRGDKAMTGGIIAEV